MLSSLRRPRAPLILSEHFLLTDYLDMPLWSCCFAPTAGQQKALCKTGKLYAKTMRPLISLLLITVFTLPPATAAEVK